MAGLLLQRLLNYCAPGSASRPETRALVAETNSPAAAKLAELGLLAENVSGRLASCDPALYPVLMIAGSNAAWQEAAPSVSNLATLRRARRQAGAASAHRRFPRRRAARAVSGPEPD